MFQVLRLTHLPAHASVQPLTSGNQMKSELHMPKSIEDRPKFIGKHHPMILELLLMGRLKLRNP